MKTSALLVLFVVGCLAAGPLPSFDYRSLDTFSSQLLTSLLNHGGLVIDNLPGFSEARGDMVHHPLSFDAADLGSSLDTDEVTGLTRLTVSSSVSSGVRESTGPMSELSPLRDIVDEAVEKFLQSLSTAVPNSLAGVTHPNGAVSPLTALGKGEGLEHYHYYTKPDAFQPYKSTVMELHRDVGCFIAMTVGGSSSPSSSVDPFVLSILTSNGEVVPASVSSGSLIILLGSGISEFITSSLPFPALPHSLSVRSLETFSDRSWYGRMYFPPASSLLYDGTLFRDTYRQLARDETMASNGIRGASNGCGDNEIFCWKQCMDASELSCDPSSALCFDKGDNTVILFPDSRDMMCPSGMANCELVCPESLNGVDNTSNTNQNETSGFCKGIGTNMFMDGFQFVFAGDSLCLNFFFIPATMDTWWKFLFGVIGQFSLAVIVEGLSLVRRKTYKSLQEASPGQEILFKALLTGLHIGQALLGYLIMLGAMSYSLDIFFAVLCGLGVGYVLFNSSAPVSKKAEPCCVENYDSVN